MTSETEEKQKTEDGKKKLTEIADKLQGLAKPVLDIASFLIPLMIKYGEKVREIYGKLPQNVIKFIVGFIFCFFGGLYPVFFAAVEAAEQCGRAKVMAALSEISDEILKIIDESKKDDKVDADGDGKADVTQIEGKELVARKTLLVMRKMDPKRVDDAMASMYQVWMAVAAVITIEFARAISMALAIADFMKYPVDRFIAPTIQLAVPDDYDKWVPVLLGWICKSIGMSIAWYVQTVRSAFASALTGGLMMARSAYEALLIRDIRLGGLIKDKHEDSYLDEVLSYAFAALGFSFQVMIGFKMPFPLNLLLWPFQVAEFALRWAITNNSSIPA
mmetsp:Transcript_130722/g.194786  ORF Transcript_130722/g.194786 Transcript_130722/m.194786 type:complete len:332 (+) Transcript_130722:93-1088(+)|eukprot:CAMPEP_0117037372 /NCGR_PEP_ID=MMETSP0472-20121206/26387_1 /TAXON_ID=693140 ORGANISM="Tiarina fusus, Strain LIS" /NCGR_SAMPLE_ID=MMETSP0472 /ASSEMBLY_ACC=CAM_ASM_000603 /LENGTH=331 /DNA_ID=CAMNT_0004747345 /DNA_START=73 /DNA_END=1068 /DNA_ORIENTATION=-